MNQPDAMKCKQVLTVQSQPQSGKTGFIHFLINVDNKAKLSLYRYGIGRHQVLTRFEIPLNDPDIRDALYMTVFSNSREQIDYRILWVGEPQSGDDGTLNPDDGGQNPDDGGQNPDDRQENRDGDEKNPDDGQAKADNGGLAR
jgi:ABC-type transport system substrate-binding protein